MRVPLRTSPSWNANSDRMCLYDLTSSSSHLCVLIASCSLFKELSRAVASRSSFSDIAPGTVFTQT